MTSMKVVEFAKMLRNSIEEKINFIPQAMIGTRSSRMYVDTSKTLSLTLSESYL
jgi:hypothetical protein